MNNPRAPKVAGIHPTVPSPVQNAAADRDVPAPAEHAGGRNADVQDRLAGWVSDLTTLHELTEQLARTDGLDAVLHELLRAGAALAGARRGMIVLEPADGEGPRTTVGLGLGRAEIGTMETVPRSAVSYGRILDGLPERDERTDEERARAGVAHPDLLHEPDLDPRHREVAARLGFAASYAVPLRSGTAGRLGAAVWLYDEPTEPVARQRDLLDLYVRQAGEHVARQRELARVRAAVTTLREELLPSRLPRAAGVRLAVRHRTGPHGGGDWYDALPLPEGALGLSVGGVTGTGPSAVAAMGRLRASLRAYAVMEGEDPVAVLSDLELLLRLTEPARSATALFAHCEPGPARHRVVLAGAGHCPPLLTGADGAEFVETSLSAPLGMLSAWEAPSVVVEPTPGQTLLLYTDGLLHRTGRPADEALERLRAAAASVPAALRADPEAVADHVLGTVLPDGTDGTDGTGDAGSTGSGGASGSWGAGVSAGGPGRADDPRRAGGPYSGGTEDLVLLAACFG